MMRTEFGRQNTMFWWVMCQDLENLMGEAHSDSGAKPSVWRAAAVVTMLLSRRENVKKMAIPAWRWLVLRHAEWQPHFTMPQREKMDRIWCETLGFFARIAALLKSRKDLIKWRPRRRQLGSTRRAVLRPHHRHVSQGLDPSRQVMLSLTASAKTRACGSVSNAISRVVRVGRPGKSFEARTIGVPLLLRLTL